jgi:hypothetical protein
MNTVNIKTKKYLKKFLYLPDDQFILSGLFLCFADALSGANKKNTANEAAMINEKKIKFKSTIDF